MAEPAETLAPEPPRAAWWAGPWPLAAVFFAWCLCFYTRNYTHPFYYEKDAPSKVAQVLNGERNYFHPLLMVNTTSAALRLTGTPRTEQGASNAGHLVMAVFGAVSVVALVLLGWRCGGWLGGFGVGVLLGLNDLLLQLTHYFKEDPALLLGLALAFLAMKLFHERPTLARAAFVGAACGVAIAGKYVGVAALILALPLVLAMPGARLARCGILLGACLAVLLAINYQWVLDFSGLRHGFHSEMHDLLDRDSMLKKVPHIAYVRDLYRRDLPAPVAAGVLLLLAHLARVGGRRRPVEWMLLAYPVVFTLILAWSPRLFERHFLPVFICLWTASALGWVHAARWLGQKFPRWPHAGHTLALAALAFVAIRLEHRFSQHLRALDTDHRALLAAWIREHLPPGAVIAEDRRVFLVQPDGQPRPDLALPQRIITRGWLSDLRTLEALRKKGVTHLAMHELGSGRFMRGGRNEHRESDAEPDVRDSPQRRTFYGELEPLAHLLWEINDAADGAMNPGLTLYALDPEK